MVTGVGAYPYVALSRADSENEQISLLLVTYHSESFKTAKYFEVNYSMVTGDGAYPNVALSRTDSDNEQISLLLVTYHVVTK